MVYHFLANGRGTNLGGAEMTIKASSINAITMARTVPVRVQVTYWKDGVARFDGKSGPRQGPWEAQVDRDWFTRAAKLARNIEPGWRGEADEALVTLVLDTDDSRLSYDASAYEEPAEFWILSTFVDGMVQRTRWSPLDISGAADFSPFTAGTPIWLNIGDAAAGGLAREGEVLVLAGARVSTATHPSLQEAYQDIRGTLIDSGDLILEEEHFRLGRHLLFQSPSAAASVLVGSNTSGRRAWKGATGRAWSELDLDH